MGSPNMCTIAVPIMPQTGLGGQPAALGMPGQPHLELSKSCCLVKSHCLVKSWFCVCVWSGGARELASTSTSLYVGSFCSAATPEAV